MLLFLSLWGKILSSSSSGSKKKNETSQHQYCAYIAFSHSTFSIHDTMFSHIVWITLQTDIRTRGKKRAKEMSFGCLSRSWARKNMFRTWRVLETKWWWWLFCSLCRDICLQLLICCRNYTRAMTKMVMEVHKIYSSARTPRTVFAGTFPFNPGNH